MFKFKSEADKVFFETQYAFSFSTIVGFDTISLMIAEFGPYHSAAILHINTKCRWTFSLNEEDGTFYFKDELDAIMARLFI